MPKVLELQQAQQALEVQEAQQALEVLQVQRVRRVQLRRVMRVISYTFQEQALQRLLQLRTGTKQTVGSASGRRVHKTLYMSVVGGPDLSPEVKHMHLA